MDAEPKAGGIQTYRPNTSLHLHTVRPNSKLQLTELQTESQLIQVLFSFKGVLFKIPYYMLIKNSIYLNEI